MRADSGRTKQGGISTRRASGKGQGVGRCRHSGKGRGWAVQVLGRQDAEGLIVGGSGNRGQGAKVRPLDSLAACLLPLLALLKW